MAIAFDYGNGNWGNGDIVSWSHTCSGSDRILIACIVHSRGISGGIKSVTYGGQALSYLGYVGTVNNWHELWYKITPLTGTNTLLVTYNNAVASSGGSASFTGVSSLDTFRTGSGTGTTGSVSIPGVSGNYWAIAACASKRADPTPGAGQTQRWEAGVGRPFPTNGCSDQDGVFSWTFSSALWTVVGVRLVPKPEPPIHVRVGEIWKLAKPHVKVAGVWRECKVHVKHGGAWDEII